MSGRSKGREIALQILYQSEWGAVEDIDMAIDDYVNALSTEIMSENDPALAFSKTRLQGVLDRKGEIDAILKKNARRWSLGRMSGVDRNILRIGIFELCYCPDIPPKVAINEAVKLAKKFSSGESSAFVNGILDAVLRNKGLGNK